MKLEILTPKGIEFGGEVENLVLPTQAGQISVLNLHAPLISVLKPGKIKVRTSKEDVSREIEGGILEVAENKAIILLKKF